MRRLFQSLRLLFAACVLTACTPARTGIIGLPSKKPKFNTHYRRNTNDIKNGTTNRERPNSSDYTVKNTFYTLLRFSYCCFLP